MAASVKIAPRNSIFFLSDARGGVPPRPVWGALFLASPSCISVGCRMFLDGETEVVIGALGEVDPGNPAAFTGTLETPNRAVILFTVEEERILEVPVGSTSTQIKIWVNHPTEPDQVVIGLE